MLKNTSSMFFLASLLFHVECTNGQTADEIIAKIVQAGQQTQSRLQTDGASWTSTMELPDGITQATIEHVVEPHRRFIKVSILNGRRPQEIARVIERDGFWYISELDQSYKCRPYEAILALPSIYHLISLSDLNVVTAAGKPSEFGDLQSVSGDTALFRTPFPPEKLSQLQGVLAGFEAVRQSEDADQTAIDNQIANIRGLIDNGVQVAINMDNGYISAGGVPGKRQTVDRFNWRDPDADDSNLFDVNGRRWEDRTESLTNDPASINNLMMIGYCRAWQPGGAKLDTDTVLLNVKSGRVLRVPFRHGICLPGCFSRDRKKVFVSGIVAVEGRASLFEIDLVTGAHRELGVGQMRGVPMFPSLSPDGLTLAVTEMAPGMNAEEGSPESLLNSQVFLVDLVSGEAKPLGPPLDTAFVSWLPDASGLLLITRKHVDMDKPSIDSVARLNMDGTVHEMFAGTSPQIVLSGTRILFQEQQTGHWYTCDLTGADRKLLGNGHAKLGFPSPAPHGYHVAMMRFDKTNGPRPFLVDVQSGEATPVLVADGLWTIPAWK
jgi:hypothetical protein